MGNDSSKEQAKTGHPPSAPQQQQQRAAVDSSKKTTVGIDGADGGAEGGGLSPRQPTELDDTWQAPATPMIESQAVSPDVIAQISFFFKRPPIGKGGFSTVYEGLYFSHPVAVKVLALRNPSEHAMFEQELQVLLLPALRHVNLLPLLAYCRERPAFVFPRLKPLSRDRLPRLPASVRMQVSMDVARGLAHMHSMGYVHNDMKPDNVLLEFNDQRLIVRAYVGDLGCAKSMQVPVQPFGTVLFMDPGLNPSGHPCLPKGADDTYSFGLTMVCIFTNTFPENPMDLVRMWAMIDVSAPAIAALARRMTLPNPALRPTCADVLAELMRLDDEWKRLAAASRQHVPAAPAALLPQQQIAPVPQQAQQHQNQHLARNNSNV